MLNCQVSVRRFVSADYSVDVVVRSIEAMCVDRGGAGLKPDAGGRRPSRLPSEYSRRQHSRLKNLFSIRVIVAAVDVASCEVDDNVGSFDLDVPFSDVRAIPLYDSPRPNIGSRTG